MKITKRALNPHAKEWVPKPKPPIIVSQQPAWEPPMQAQPAHSHIFPQQAQAFYGHGPAWHWHPMQQWPLLHPMQRMMYLPYYPHMVHPQWGQNYYFNPGQQVYPYNQAYVGV